MTAGDTLRSRRQHGRDVSPAVIRSPWASVSESDGGTRLSFPSTAQGREVCATERRGESLSHAAFAPRSSARPWPLPWQSLVFAHAPSVFIPDHHAASAASRWQADPAGLMHAERAHAGGLAMLFLWAPSRAIIAGTARPLRKFTAMMHQMRQMPHGAAIKASLLGTVVPTQQPGSGSGLLGNSSTGSAGMPRPGRELQRRDPAAQSRLNQRPWRGPNRSRSSQT